MNHAHTDEEVMGAALRAGPVASLDIAGDEDLATLNADWPAHRQADDQDLGVQEDGCYRLTAFL